VDLHDPAHARAHRQEQGIRALRAAEKSCVFMHRWNVETYPFGCANLRKVRGGRVHAK
jgi:hypothetical protein